MKTVAMPDCFRGNTGRRKHFLEKARQMTGAERVIWLSFGPYETDGNLAGRSMSSEAELLIESGADLVLVPPVIEALEREGTEIFAESALISRLHCIDEIALPVSGKTPGTELRRVAMFLFQEPRDFQKEVKKERAEGRTTEEAKRICAERFVPGAGAILADPLDSKSVEFLKCMYQLYLCIPVSWVPMPGDDAEDGDMSDGNSAESGDIPAASLFERPEMDEAVSGRLRRLAEEGREKFAARVRNTAGGTEKIRKMVESAAFCDASSGTVLIGSDREESAELRKFLLRLLSGIRMEDSQMCGFYTCCPYALVAAEADAKDEWLQEVRKSSWVPLLTEEELRKKAESDENTKIFLRIEEAAAELTCFIQKEVWRSIVPPCPAVP